MEQRIYITEKEYAALIMEAKRDRALAVSFGGGRVWLTRKDGHIESLWALQSIADWRAPETKTAPGSESKEAIT